MVKQTHVPFKGLHFRKVRISTVKELAAALNISSRTSALANWLYINYEGQVCPIKLDRVPHFLSIVNQAFLQGS
jgi:hypothetical protein